ncbi:MAG: hypothetical protein ACREC9_02790 [Methylocella sp.]
MPVNPWKQVELAPPGVATIRPIPRLLAPIKCRWQIDAMTGALSAVWWDPSADAGTMAAAEQISPFTFEDA